MPGRLPFPRRRRVRDDGASSPSALRPVALAVASSLLLLLLHLHRPSLRPTPTEESPEPRPTTGSGGSTSSIDTDAAAGSDRSDRSGLIEEAAWDAPIHFVYLARWPTPGSPMPEAFKRNLDMWRSANGAQRVKVWDADGVSRLVRSKHGPDVATVYDSASSIQQADLARYAILAAEGGWYFDLDVGVDCHPSSRPPAGVTHAGAETLRACTNSVAALEAFLEQGVAQPSTEEDLLYGGAMDGGAELREGSFGVASSAGFLGEDAPSAVLFWERGRLSVAEAVESARRPCRRGLPEWRTRVANYAMYARPGAPMMATALALAVERVKVLGRKPAAGAGGWRVGGSPCARFPGGEEEGREYEVVFSTGPDVMSEAAATVAGGAARRRPTGATASATAANDGSPSEPHALIGPTGSRVLLVDPGAMVVNANSWSWRGAGNVAMETSQKSRRRE